MFTWNDGYLPGVPIIDSEHKTLFAIAGELNEAVIHGDNTRTQKNLLTPYTLGQYLLMDYMNRKTRTVH
jgi:hypothetical protein